MPDDIEDMWVRIRYSDELTGKIGETTQALTTWRDSTNKSTLDLSRWGAAIAADVAPIAAIGAAMYTAATNAGNFGHAIEESSRQLGLSTDQFQQWSHVAIASGSDADAFTWAVRMMSSRMKDAADTSTDLGKYMQILGVSVKNPNGTFRDMNDVLLDLIPAISALPDGFDKNQASLVIFGRSWTQIAPLLKLSREEIEKLIAQAPIIDSDKISAMDEFHTKLALLNENWGRFYAEVGTEVIPILEDLLGVLGDSGWSKNEFLNFLQNASFGVHTFITGLKLLWLEGARTRGVFGGGPEAEAEYQKVFQQIIDEGAKQEATSRGESPKINDILTKINSGGTVTASERAWVKTNEPALYARLPAVAPSIPPTIAQDQTQEEKDRLTDLISSWKEYQDQLKKVGDETKNLADINKNFARDLSTLNPFDVAGARNLIIRHKFDVQDQEAKIAESVQGITAPAIEYNAIQSGIPLDKIPGTPQYTEAQAKTSGQLTAGTLPTGTTTKSGDLIINIDGKQIAKIPGVVTVPASKMNLTQRGVRIG